jgi:hypothetical protein
MPDGHDSAERPVGGTDCRIAEKWARRGWGTTWPGWTDWEPAQYCSGAIDKRGGGVPLGRAPVRAYTRGRRLTQWHPDTAHSDGRRVKITVAMPQVRNATRAISRVLPDCRTIARTRPLEVLIIGDYVRGLSDRDIESLMQEAGPEWSRCPRARPFESVANCAMQ